MICPECKAEYRPGFTRCADCDVDLVWETPQEAASSPQHTAEPGDPNEDPFCSFWKGDDPRVHAELCEVLDEAGIPHNSVFRRDHLFNLKNFPAYEVGVPFSLFEKAEIAVKDAFGADEYDAMKLLEAPDTTESDSSTIRKLPATLTPVAEENIPGPPSAGEEGMWYLEDATEKVWAEENGVSADFLIAALHENGIRCRTEQSATRAELFVLPEDETRAREIVREVVEQTPPE